MEFSSNYGTDSTDGFMNFYEDQITIVDDDERIVDRDDVMIIEEEDSHVIYTYNCLISQLSCRSFEFRSDAKETKQVRVSIQGFRILQDSSGPRAEFHVHTSIDECECDVWRRFEDFELLAKSCLEYTKKKNCISETAFSSWFSIFFTGSDVATFRNDFQQKRFPINPLKETLNSWAQISNSKSWTRDISINYLLMMIVKLDSFLKHLLYEIPNPLILLEFSSPRLSLLSIASQRILTM
jgi:hypothetical protein